MKFSSDLNTNLSFLGKTSLFLGKIIGLLMFPSTCVSVKKQVDPNKVTSVLQKHDECPCSYTS